jgi:hypothetical protein
VLLDVAYQVMPDYERYNKFQAAVVEAMDKADK